MVGVGPVMGPVVGIVVGVVVGWLLKDPDTGLDFDRSSDLQQWDHQGKMLESPGERNDDGNVGKHPDVLVVGDRAFNFSFTHPHRGVASAGRVMHDATRRSSIQVAELHIASGELTCNQDEPCFVYLTPP